MRTVFQIGLMVHCFCKTWLIFFLEMISHTMHRNTQATMQKSFKTWFIDCVTFVSRITLSQNESTTIIGLYHILNQKHTISAIYELSEWVSLFLKSILWFFFSPYPFIITFSLCGWLEIEYTECVEEISNWFVPARVEIETWLLLTFS